MSNMTILQIEWSEIWLEILKIWPNWKPNPGAEKRWYLEFKDQGKSRVLAAIRAMAATKPPRPRIEQLSEILTPRAAKVNNTEFSKKLVWLATLAGQTQSGILEQLPGYNAYKAEIAQLADEWIAHQYCGLTDQERINAYHQAGLHFAHAKNKVAKENAASRTTVINSQLEYYQQRNK